MPVVSDSLDASEVINNNGVIEPKIPTANAAIDNVTHGIDDKNSLSVNGEKNNDKKEKKKKKKVGPFSFFRAALVALRTDNKKKSTPTKVVDTEVKNNKDASNGNWKKIVGSMRPLHLQDNNSPPSFLPSPSPARSASYEWLNLEDNHSIQSYQPSSPSSSSISGGTMSQYASASNLQALDDGDEEDDPDVVFDAIRGDEMIDSKAEEFIAQFYQQMKIDKHYHHHNSTTTITGENVNRFDP